MKEKKQTKTQAINIIRKLGRSTHTVTRAVTTENVPL